MLSELYVGAHHFRASISYDGRKPVMHKALPVIEQWDIVIGGNKIPALTKEDVATIRAKARESFESSMNEQIEAQLQLTDDEHKAMLQFLPFFGCKTFRYSKLLQSPKDTDQLQAHFQIAALVIEKADQGL